MRPWPLLALLLISCASLDSLTSTWYLDECSAIGDFYCTSSTAEEGRLLVTMYHTSFAPLLIDLDQTPSLSFCPDATLDGDGILEVAERDRVTLTFTCPSPIPSKTVGTARFAYVNSESQLPHVAVISHGKSEVMLDQCTGREGLSCLDKASFNDTAIRLYLSNTAGYELALDLDTAPSGLCSPVGISARGKTSGLVEWRTGTRMIVTIHCSQRLGEHIDGELTYRYKNLRSGLSWDGTVRILAYR